MSENVKQKKGTMRQIIREATRIGELNHTLENISTDDRCEIGDYSDEEIVFEAKYVLGCFYEGGHINNDSLNGAEGPEMVRWAKKQIRQLKKLISKYE